MEIEINFRFDEDGRTANTKVDGGNHESENKNKNHIDYGFKAEMTDLKEWFESPVISKPDSSTATEALKATATATATSTRMDDILLDCEISDNLIMPRTYWMPANGTTKPRCALEQFAMDIFHHHVPSDGFDYDRETSGAEWWCQLRPSPETGRHNNALQQKDEKHENNDDPFANGISFHVDKDEELRILTGGSTNVHPHLSTITYLTDLGSPTLIIDCLVHPLNGEWIVPEESVEGFVSWPSVGKHTSFDGRYLHASPPILMGDTNAFQKQIELAMAKASENEDAEGATAKSKRRRYRRVTFLVNIWLNYKPYNVNPFPESMINKMSGLDEKQRKGLVFTKTVGDGSVYSSSSSSSKTALHVQNTHIRSDQVTEVGGDGATDQTQTNTQSDSTTGNSTTTTTGTSTTVYTAQKFSWPLGDSRSGEKLECRIPLKTIAKASDKGGNVRIQWQKSVNNPSSVAAAAADDDDDCFRLFDGKTTALPPPDVGEILKDESPLPLPSSSPSSKEIIPRKEEEDPQSNHRYDETNISGAKDRSKRPRIS